MVGDYINSVKTIFYFNFNYIKVLNSMDIHKPGSPEKLSVKNLLEDCKLVIRPKFVNNRLHCIVIIAYHCILCLSSLLSLKLFRNIVQYGLESGDKSVVHETLISIPILFPPDFDTRYGSKVRHSLLAISNTFILVRSSF